MYVYMSVRAYSQVIHIHERMTHQESRFDKNILLNVMQDMLGAHQVWVLTHTHTHTERERERERHTH